MSDTIPYHIQAEIVKNLPIKSLVRFRLVSKQWKSLIESSKFIACYRAQQKHKHHLLVRYWQASDNDSDVKYVSIVDDDTFPQHKVSLTVPMAFKLQGRNIVSSQGLLFMYRCYGAGTTKGVVWNPTIRKSVDIDLCCALKPDKLTCFGFGVCPDTCDPKIVKITSYSNSNEWHIVFEVAIDRFMYWRADERIYEDDRYQPWYERNLIVSFDMTSEEFTEINLPDSLEASSTSIRICNIRESLGVVQLEAEEQIYSVWKMMEPCVSNSFTKLYTINTTHVIRNIHGFRKSGEPFAETENNPDEMDFFAYDPDSNHINYIGIPGARSYYSVNSYIETLILLDH